MSSLEDRITDVLTSTVNDAELAKTLVDSGVLAEIIRRGTYDEDAVQKRLNYSSPAALRAALSKARRRKATFPLPVMEGRRWARSAVDEYRKTHRRPSSTSVAGTATSTSTGVTAPITSTTDSSGVRGSRTAASTGGSGSLTSGTGVATFTGDHRQDPDQWRNT